MSTRNLFVALALLSGNAWSFSLVVPRPTGGRSSSSSFGQPRATGRLRATAALDELDVATDTNMDMDVLGDLGIHIPFGLRQTLLANAHHAFSKRIWIVDNSGSMAMWDGHQALASHGNQHRSSNEDVTCTRWDEVQETVNCHAHLSAVLGAPTDFQLLNLPQKIEGPLSLIRRGPQKVKVGYTNGKTVARDCRRAQSILVRNPPKGATPLSTTIAEVRTEIIRMKPQLEAQGTKVCLVIATDGANYHAGNIGLHMDEAERNEELVKALESLQDLPVCVVVRLCTDYEPVVEFYNDLDAHLDNLEIDVIDDHMAEATEVYRHNPWLNYAMIIHRMREMGQDHRLFDLLDERPLDQHEIWEFCTLLFGRKELLLEEKSWDSFVEEVDRLQRKERMQWNPHTKTMAPWIDVEQLALALDEDDCYE